jgi:TolA-binding protein
MTGSRPTDLPPQFRIAPALALFLGLAVAAHSRATGGPSASPAPVRTAPAAPVHDSESEGLLNLGATLAGRRDYETAEIAYWQVLKNADATTAETKRALMGLARLHRREGALTKAAAIYEKYIKEYPDDDRLPDALLELGRTLRDMGSYPMAISAFYSVINSTLKFPSHDFEHYELLAKTAQFEIAQTHFDAGEFADAGKYFSRVRLLDLAPADRARAHFMAAYSQTLSGDLDAAVASLRSFIQDWPLDQNIPEARYLLATSLRQLKRPEEALAVTFDLLSAEHAKSAADPQHWSYWQHRTGNQVANEFFQSGDTFAALAVYKGLAGITDAPEWRLPVTYQIALCYERLRQADQARASYRLIIDAGLPKDGRKASPEIAALARMASWRLAQLDWREQADRRVSDLFTGAPPKSASAAPLPHTPSS